MIQLEHAFSFGNPHQSCLPRFQSRLEEVTRQFHSRCFPHPCDLRHRIIMSRIFGSLRFAHTVSGRGRPRAGGGKSLGGSARWRFQVAAQDSGAQRRSQPLEHERFPTIPPAHHSIVGPRKLDSRHRQHSPFLFRQDMFPDPGYLLEPQISQMGADGETQKENLRKSASSAVK